MVKGAHQEKAKKGREDQWEKLAQSCRGRERQAVQQLLCGFGEREAGAGSQGSWKARAPCIGIQTGLWGQSVTGIEGNSTERLSLAPSCQQWYGVWVGRGYNASRATGKKVQSATIPVRTSEEEPKATTAGPQSRGEIC